MNSIINITHDCDLGIAPAHSLDSRFYVKAIEPLDLIQTQIAPGDYLLIDPATKPIRGSYVLVGEAIAPWAGQEKISGSVVKTLKMDGGADAH